MVVRRAQRSENRSRSDVGTTSEVGRWVPKTGMIPNARHRATTSRARVLNAVRCADVPTTEVKKASSSTCEEPHRQLVLGRDLAGHLALHTRQGPQQRPATADLVPHQF